MSLIVIPSEERKTELTEKFFKRFGRLKVPLCAKCHRAVDNFGFDYNWDRDLFIIFSQCHSDREQLMIRPDHFSKYKKFAIKKSFVEGFTTRENGIRVAYF